MSKVKEVVFFFLACAVVVPVLLGGVVYAQQLPDHHKCYDVMPFTLPMPLPVLLTDQFGTLEGEALHLVRFSPPVEKMLPGGESSPIMNPEDHLAWYEFIQPAEPRHLLVSNQFGEDQKMTVGDTRFLLLPAWKMEVNNQPTGLNHPQDLDHYLCYDVLEGTPVGLEGVTLTDQFGTETVTVGAPIVFCNPVQKTFMLTTETYEIFDPENHLACYDISPHVLPPFLEVVAMDQFTEFLMGPILFTVLENQLLCVPSQKVLCVDNDNDGHIDQSCGGDDCDDTDASVYTGATEVCDGKDNDCDVYPAVPADESDDDSDGYVECTSWVGTVPGVLGGDDCDDGNDNIYPTNTNANCDCADPIPQGETESAAAGNCADGEDNDCDGSADTDPQCSTGGTCSGSSAEASTYEVHPVHGTSGLSKHGAYLLLPLGAWIAIRVWRRKR